MTETDPGTGRERRATNLELFVDLVFVFAVTQVAAAIERDLSPAGVARGLLLAWIVWWSWSQFAWLGTSIDLDQRSWARPLVLSAVPAALLMAVSLPVADGPDGMRFALAYLAVALWTLGIQGVSTWGDPATRRAFRNYAPGAALAPCLLVVGAALDPPLRTGTWALFTILSIGSALLAGRSNGQSEWRVDPSHFSERHALFVIIALGEVLVTTGATATGRDLDTGLGGGLVAAVAVACVFWWTYFAFIPAVGERVLRAATGAERGRRARDVFTFGHFPIVLGVVLYALVVRHLMEHPTEPLEAGARTVLAGSIAVFIGGFMALHAAVARGLAPERPAAVLAVVLLAGLAGPHIPGSVLLAAVAGVLAAMQLTTVRRVHGLPAVAAEPGADQGG